MVASISFPGRECRHADEIFAFPARTEFSLTTGKRFDAKSLEELAASFKTQGILAPLLVRELEESKYEVVAGARRLRAAKLAELERLPIRVVKLTDAEAIEAQCVELSIVRKCFFVH
jgi:ParB/RepB/Spo0J family partition protein